MGVLPQLDRASKLIGLVHAEIRRFESQPLPETFIRTVNLNQFALLIRLLVLRMFNILKRRTESKETQKKVLKTKIW